MKCAVFLLILMYAALCSQHIDYIQLKQRLDSKEDIARFQQLLWQSQHPYSCHTARFLIVGNIHMAGLGSHLHGVIPALWRGLMEHRVVLLDRNILSVYGNRKSCPIQNYECYYLPLSNCSLDDVTTAMLKSGQALRLRSRFKLPEHTLSYFTSELSQPYNTAWYAKELTRYFTRPNNCLSRYVEQLRLLSGLNATRFASLHYRSGKLLKVEGNRVPLWVYTYMLQRHAQLLYPIEHVLVESDDSAVFDVLKKELREIQIHRVPPSLFATTAEATYGSHVMAALKRSSSTTTDHDEALVLLATLELLSQADFFLGAFSSNLGRFVYELMARYNFPPAVYDVDNDIWFSGGVTASNLICTHYTHGKI